MPGIIFKNYGKLEILLSNLSTKTINLHNKKIVAYLHLYHNYDLFDINNFSDFSDFNLPPKNSPNLIKKILLFLETKWMD